MDAQAISLIQKTAVDAEGNRMPPTFRPTIALPNDYLLHDLEQYQFHRSHFRGTFSTSSLEAFADYTKREAARADESKAPGPAPGFVDVDSMSARIFFDLLVKDADEVTQPGHALHAAVLSLKKTAEHAAVLQVNGRQLKQVDLIEWLEDWQPNIVALADEAGAAVALPAALAAIRRLEIASKTNTTHTTEALRAERTAMEQVEARGAGQLPTRIVFRCIPYPGLPARDFPLRVAVITSHDKPMLALRIVNLEAITEAIAEDFRKALAEGIGDAATLTLGTFNPHLALKA
ncbi:DUF2303 family protein [Pseudoxanthomonas sp. LjRoot143]|uniref:DUF2303 family protein n=1 Tax=Pseudoxanthomonas sp. LjRoot143 TaxID=3342266 RepID=UPI003ED10A09